jgi:nucleoside phosphorylase
MSVRPFPLTSMPRLKMLDEVHYDIPQDASHPNLYTLGRISEHNVVMVCLPAGQIGPVQPAAVVGQMMAKFSSIQHILIVGIGGGIPRAETDIRLGDVVVS